MVYPKSNSSLGGDGLPGQLTLNSLDAGIHGGVQTGSILLSGGQRSISLLLGIGSGSRNSLALSGSDILGRSLGIPGGALLSGNVGNLVSGVAAQRIINSLDLLIGLGLGVSVRVGNIQTIFLDLDVVVLTSTEMTF